MTSRSYSTPKGIVHDSWILLVDAVDAFFRFLEQLGSHHIPDARGGIRGVAATLSHKKHHWTQGAETPICITSSRECHGNHPSIGFHTARIVWAGSHLGRPRQTWCNCRVLAGYCEDLWRVVTTSHETPAAHMSSETGIPEREDLTLWLKGQKNCLLSAWIFVALDTVCSEWAWETIWLHSLPPQCWKEILNQRTVYDMSIMVVCKRSRNLNFIWSLTHEFPPRIQCSLLHTKTPLGHPPGCHEVCV